MKAKCQFWMYRISTIAKSFKALYTLSPEKVKAFVDSYKVFDFDWANEEELIREMGVDYYKQVQQKIIDWYSVLNHLCAIGQVEKMYIPPAIDLSKSIIANQVLFEKKMCHDLGLKKGHKVLDIGCGRGRVASHVATHTGAHVTGINIDHTQLESARKYALAKKLPCQFHFGDLNVLPLPFENNSLDAVYHIQVFSLAKDLHKLLKDIHRIMKPGAKLSCLDWLCYDKYDKKNPHHVSLMRRVKPLIGAIGTLTAKEYADHLEKAGFKVLINENASVGGYQAPLIENADRFYSRVTKVLNFLVTCKILPRHFNALFDRLIQDGEAFVEADRLGLVTTTHQFVAQKV